MNVRAFRIPAILLSTSLAACGGGGTNAVPAQSSASIPQNGSFQVPVSNQSAEAAPAASKSSDVSVYRLGDGSSNVALVNDMRFGADGKLYYSTMGQFPSSGFPTTGEVGTFDLVAHTQSYQVVPYAPGYVQETSDGSVWVTELNNISGNPTIDRYSALNGNDTTLAVPKAPWWFDSGFGNGIAGDVAVGPDGMLWFGSNNSGQVIEIDPVTNVLQLYGLPDYGLNYIPSPQYMIIGSDRNLWVTDAFNDGVDRVTTTGSAVGTASFFPLPQGPVSSSNSVDPQGIIEGYDRKLYAADPDPWMAGSVNVAPIGTSPSFTAIPMPSIGIDPYIFARAHGKIYFNELRYSGIGMYNTATRHMVILPLSPAAYGGLVVDSSGTPWIGCNSQGVACIEQVKLTSKWSVFPSTSVTLYTQDPQGNSLPPGLIGIGETGNSGPFKISSLNTSVCTANFIPGFDHNIQVNPVAAGTCTLAITDLYSRTVTVAVTVVSGSGYPQAGVHNKTLLQIRQGLLPRPMLHN